MYHHNLSFKVERDTCVSNMIDSSLIEQDRLAILVLWSHAEVTASPANCQTRHIMLYPSICPTIIQMEHSFITSLTCGIKGTGVNLSTCKQIHFTKHSVQLPYDLCKRSERLVQDRKGWKKIGKVGIKWRRGLSKLPYNGLQCPSSGEV